MTRGKEYDDIMSEMVAQAVAGDMKSRLYVEVMVPFSDCLRDAFDKIGEIRAKNPSMTPREFADQPDFDRLMLGFLDTIVGQITVLIGSMHNGDDLDSMVRVLSALIDKIHDRTGVALTRMVMSRSKRK